MTAYNPTVQCDSCGDQYHSRMTPGNRDTVEKWLREEGWLVNGDSHVCPACAGQRPG